MGKGDSNDSEDKKIQESLEAIRAEAVKNAVNAFNEGYLLGIEHARKVIEDYEGKD